MTNARGGQTGLKVLLKTYFSPQFSRKWRSSLIFKIFSDVAPTIFSGKEFQFSQESDNIVSVCSVMIIVKGQAYVRLIMLTSWSERHSDFCAKLTASRLKLLNQSLSV